MKFYIWFLVIVIMNISVVFAHDGNLNKYGCHNNNRTGIYHCHGGETGLVSERSDVLKQMDIDKIHKNKWSVIFHNEFGKFVCPDKDRFNLYKPNHCFNEGRNLICPEKIPRTFKYFANAEEQCRIFYGDDDFDFKSCAINEGLHKICVMMDFPSDDSMLLYRVCKSMASILGSNLHPPSNVTWQIELFLKDKPTRIIARCSVYSWAYFWN